MFLRGQVNSLSLPHRPGRRRPPQAEHPVPFQGHFQGAGPTGTAPGSAGPREAGPARPNAPPPPRAGAGAAERAWRGCGLGGNQQVKPAPPAPACLQRAGTGAGACRVASVQWPGPHAAPRAGDCCCPCCASSSRAPPPSSLQLLSAMTTKPTLPSGTGATTVMRTMNFTFATQVSAGEGARGQRLHASWRLGRGHWGAQT